MDHSDVISKPSSHRQFCMSYGYCNLRPAVHVDDRKPNIRFIIMSIMAQSSDILVSHTSVELDPCFYRHREVCDD